MDFFPHFDKNNLKLWKYNPSLIRLVIIYHYLTLSACRCVSDRGGERERAREIEGERER